MERILAQNIEGKVIYLLALVVLVQSAYPITGDGSVVTLLAYQLLYMSLMITGIVVARDSKFHTRLLTLLGIIWLVVAAVYAFNQTVVWALLATYVVIIIFLSVVVQVLLRYIFLAHSVTRDVLYAACAVYMLLGAIFVPIYGIIETITFSQTGGQHAFSDGSIAVGEIFPWQDFVYYSYVTLTTLGYGDILPVTMWARSAVSLQAIIGVLYITVVMARLVGLYASQETVEAEREGVGSHNHKAGLSNRSG